MTNSNGFLTGLIAGVLAGAAAGMLLTPKPGKDTRNFVGLRASEVRSRAEDYVGALREKFSKVRGGETLNDHSENGVESSS